MRDTFISKLEEIAEKDKSVILMTGDLGFGVFNNFIKKNPSQYLNAGVAEPNMIGVATGLALEGYKVFVYSIGNFATLRCVEQIRNDACYHNANVKIVSVGGGFSYGSLGISHYATEDIAILRSIPNITVLAPCTLWEAQEATEAIYRAEGTCYLRIDKSCGNEEIPINRESFRIGMNRVIREGKDCVIIAMGGILHEAQKAADILKNNGIDSGIISMHTIKPFDKENMVKIIGERKNIFTLEEHVISGGLGGTIAEFLMNYGIKPKNFASFGLDDKFSCIVGSQQYLRKQYSIDSSAITKKIISIIRG